MALLWSRSESDENGPSLSIFFEDGTTLNLTDSHPKFGEITVKLALAEEGYEEEVRDLADTVSAIQKRFRKLSERVSSNGHKILMDGDPIDETLSDFIIKLLNAESEGKAPAGDVTWKALVEFLEKLYQNPLESSRKSLYDFIARHGLTIRANGDFIAYKGVGSDYLSLHSGEGIVDGIEKNGQLPNRPGSILEIARSKVDANQGKGCAVGLHAGTVAYANTYGTRSVAVSINPRDVVSVPNDFNFQKLRTCRYEVLTDIERKTEARATVGNESQVFWDEPTKAAADDSIVDALNVAIKDEATLRLSYVDAKGRKSERVIVPTQITGNLVNVYLPEDGDAFRTLRLDRIESVLNEVAEAKSEVKAEAKCPGRTGDYYRDFLVDTFNDALGTDAVIQIGYSDANGNDSDRYIVPIQLVKDSVIARLPRENNAIRTFKLERLYIIIDDAPETVREVLAAALKNTATAVVEYKNSRGRTRQITIQPTKINDDYVICTLPKENDERRELRIDRIVSARL